jgi:hypothetical protein
MAIQYNESSTDYNALEHEYGGADETTYEPGYRLKGEKYRSVNYQYRGGDSYATHQITAAITGSATATAAITEEAFITAAITGATTVVTAVIEEAGITASISAAATVTAATFEEKFLTGAISGTGTVALASVLQEQFLTGAATGTAAVTADVQSIMIAGDITGAATVTATTFEEKFLIAAVTGTGTLNQPVLIRKVPQPELALSVTNVTGSSNAEEQQHTLELLVGV